MIGVQDLHYLDSSTISLEPALSPRARVEPNKSKKLRIPQAQGKGDRVPGVRSSQIVTESVVHALKDESFDWRTPETIASAANLPVSVVHAALENLLSKDLVRHPVGYRINEGSLYRLTSRKHTLGERVRLIRMLITRG